MKRHKFNCQKGGVRPYQKPNKHRLHAGGWKTGSHEDKEIKKVLNT
jgi:hypothetical protein